MAKVSVVIVAAGRGQRFRQDGPKQYQPLAGQTVIYHAIDSFASHPRIREIQPVIHPDDVDVFREAIGNLDVRAPVFGGATRQASVRAGLEALADEPPDLVLVHDAARPAVSSVVIDHVLDALETAVGAVPGVKIVDTVKFADESGQIIETRPRDGLWRAQTPQGFQFQALLDAHLSKRDQEFTDDAAIMEKVGHKTMMVEGAAENIKITLSEDLVKMESYMKSKITPGRPGFRTGTGFDVHRLAPGDGVTLCGVFLPCDLSLVGHSDADVALHAVTDAVLGALAEGDIGAHFPPTDERWRGASSDQFLVHAVKLAKDRGYGIGNLDLTIICERPKVGPHRETMRKSIAELCEINIDQVSVKATTTESLGFTGRGEGIAAQASILLMSRA